MTTLFSRSPWLALILAHVAHASLPLVDFDRMGTVGLAGAFAGLDLFDNTSAVAFDPSTSSILSRAVDGSLTRIGSTNQGGSIAAGCAIGSTFYLAGSFSSVSGVTAANVASYDGSSFSALGSNGPNGDVHALYCDSANSKVWAGGHFTSPGSAVAVYDVKASSWAAAPFGGLAGAAAEVLSITANSSQSSLLFTGSFITSFQGNGSTLNSTNNPNVPFSSGATPFSSSLVPIPLQNAQIVASPSSTDASFNNVQNILCPSGNDGPGQTWLGGDGSTAQITARLFQSVSASGVRLGNTFVNGRSTTTFSVTSIPDNAVQQLHYVDPTTGANQTCTTNCPLSTNSGIPYQDFTFDNALSLTGVLVTLSGWQGAGPGLHLFQLLSSGAFVSAVGSQNGQSCFAPIASNTSFTKTWTQVEANTNIAGTIQTVLVASANVGASPADSPSFTWAPYISASGEYNINMLIPGCTNFEDCARRTSVKVTVFPGGGQQPVVTSFSQQNTNDATQQIYSGPVIPSSPNFTTTITMTLADNPAGTGQGGLYELVADRVQLILTSASTSGGSSGGFNVSGTAHNAFGIFEWPLSTTASVNAAGVLPNSTETSLDTIGFNLFSGLGGNSTLTASSQSTVAAVVEHSSGAVFIGGSLALSTPSASNIAVFQNGVLAALSEGGLNGPVTSFALDGDKLFVGGSFSDTASNSTKGQLNGVAVYDVQQKTWAALQAGVDGPVTSLSVFNGQVSVAGNFTTILSAAGSNVGHESAGFAVWNVSNSAWANSGGFLVGKLSFVGNGTAPAKGQQQSQILAGNIASSLKFGASGFVFLKNGKNGEPQVTPLGVQLNEGDALPAPAATKRRREHVRRGPTAWIPHIKIPIPQLFSRQSSSLPPLPPAPPAPAPAVLAGAFWTNTTNSDQVVVIGGNFSFADGSTEAAGVGLYHPASGTLNALLGSQLNGTVRALLVDGTQLYVGGEFTIPGADVNGFAMYDLVQQSWELSGVQALQASAGSSVVVRSITTSPFKANTIIVAGSFAQAGSLPCRAICAWDSSAKQWNALGSGIQGDVASVAYAGSNLDVLVAAGSVSLSGSASNNVVQFTFNNSDWSAIGDGSDLPGPVTAVTVNDGNADSIFIAGRSSDGTYPYMAYWNGAVWESLGSTLQGATNISQLTMVPLQDNHAANSVIESDRMLLVSGTLSDSSFGNASSALFDGQTFIPYIVASSPSGTAGAVSSLFHSLSSFNFNTHVLATGVVILISIAIAAGVVFLLVLIGILWTLFSRRDDALNKFDPAEIDDDDDSTQHRPSSLLAHINAATRTTILGTQSPFHNFNAEKEEEAAAVAGASSVGHDPFAGPDASNYLRAETPSDAVAGIMAGEEEAGRPAHARYSFDGSGEGELPLTVGQELEVLDDRDHSWWYARDLRTGNEGVVPAAYLY
ncbi:hypothetical protein BV25DRAFT_1518743 [Artomyces pyxidatus]|uniref:Uncharacterized protein n=1 Tax=Artomyces pyxidatus TaxID=48021 RepID=A0ACB8TD26_9AGAM|nr:hypothetical protein BV25DRAFT_1518743 [Artomyces pyxidatus]